MFEKIEKARQVLASGSTKAAIEEYFQIIDLLLKKKNNEEAARLLQELIANILGKENKRNIYLLAEQLIKRLSTFKLKDFQKSVVKFDEFLSKTKSLYRTADESFDKSAIIAEAQAVFYKNHKMDGTVFLLEAANDLKEQIIKIYSKPRVREEEEKEAKEHLKHAIELFQQLEQQEVIAELFETIVAKQLENKNVEKAEKILDMAIDYLMDLKGEETTITAFAEIIMQVYVSLIEFKIQDILNPEMPISKLEVIKFENNIAKRFIKHAKEICLKKKAKKVILILAKELSLIGLALFEKGQEQYALAYFEEAKNYYLEVNDVDKTIDFGKNVTSLGLQLFSKEQYPMGRDYLYIAIEIAKKIDRSFEIEIYQKEAALYLKYRKYQLAYEAYRKVIEPLQALPESELRIEIPREIRQLGKERFDKNDFHYAELFYRLSAEFFAAFNQLELAADTLDASWPPMFKVRQLQTGIDLARKAATAYIEADNAEAAADVYFKLGQELLKEGHYDIALEQLRLAAQTIPEYLREEKFKPLVKVTTSFTEQCLKSGDIINARELWSAACEFNETLARSLIKRDIESVVETIEDHIKNVRKFDNEELNEITIDSAQKSAQVLSEAKDYERAAKILVSFAADFLRKNKVDYANTLFEQGASEFIKANLPREAARVLSTLARYHCEHQDHEKCLYYYRKASIESEELPEKEILDFLGDHCYESYVSLLERGASDEIIKKGFQLAIEIKLASSKEAAGYLSHTIAQKFFERNKTEKALIYYQKAIQFFLESDKQKAVIVGAEAIERGRKAFQNNMILEAEKLIKEGILALENGGQVKQAAQTARIEGEKFLTTAYPDLGLNFLNLANQNYKQLKDLQNAAEIHKTKGQFYFKKYNFNESKIEFEHAGTIYLETKNTNALKKLILELQELATKFILAKELPNEVIGEQEKQGKEFIKLAIDFAEKIKDLELSKEIKYTNWQLFAKKAMHESAYEFLQETFTNYEKLKDLKAISLLAQEVAKFATKLIQQENLAHATKYLNIVLDKLNETAKFKEAAGICLEASETFLKKNNNEVAVSWGLRATDIMLKADLEKEAIQFLKELVEQLMIRNSIENAILCYGKIAKIYEQSNRLKEVEDIALEVMAFGKANMVNNNPEAGLRLWEVALTIGAIVGEEFTGRLCEIEGQTFYEIKQFDKSIELFKESYMLFKRTKKLSRLINLGTVIFQIAKDLQKENNFDIAFKYIPLGFESLIAGKDVLLATENMFGHAKNYIEVNKDKEGFHLINTTIDTLFSIGDVVAGVEHCFVGAALLVSYGKNTEGSRLIDKGMEKVTQITDEAAIKHLATVCRNQGIILRENEKLEASHIMLASGIGILRTINDLIGIGMISIELGRTLIQRNEMNAAVEAFRNGVQLMAQGNLKKEAVAVINELITLGRKEIDNKNITTGVPLVDLSGELFILLGYPERIMVISEIFINLGGKMLAERNYEIAALYFSKAMEFAMKANLRDYLPKVGNRCIDFGFKLVKEEDPILGIQFMNAGADLISQFEQKPEKAGRAMVNFIEAINQILTIEYAQSYEDESDYLELIEQFVGSAIKFFTQISAAKSLEKLAKNLIAYGKSIIQIKQPGFVRRIFEPALRAAENAQNTKLQIEIAHIYLEHVNYLIETNNLRYLETTVNQAMNIYLSVNDMKEIRKFIGVTVTNGRELCLNPATREYGIKVINMLIGITEKLANQELYPVILLPIIFLNQVALEEENLEIVIFARQNVLRLLNSILEANYSLAILGNLSLSNMIFEWYQIAETLLQKQETFDQAINVINQTLQLAVITQQVELGNAVIEKVLETLESMVRRRTKGLELLYEILAIGSNGLGQVQQVVNLGRRCFELGKEAAQKRHLKESIDYLKAAGRIFALCKNEAFIAKVAIACATFGDQRLKERNIKEGLYYYSAALENYELSEDERSIKIIASTIEKLFESTPTQDGYLCFLIPGMVYANRNETKQAQTLAGKALQSVDSMLKSRKKELVYDSIPYLFAATDIYNQLDDLEKEMNIYDEFMFKYLTAVNDMKIIELFLDLLVRTLMRKLQKWDFQAIDELFEKITDQRVLKSKNYQAIFETINALKTGDIIFAQDLATKVNVKFERSIRDFVDSYREQIKKDIFQTGKLSIHTYMKEQPIAPLVNVLIHDLYARKEIEGKYFPIGLFVSSEQLNSIFEFLDAKLSETGKATIAEVAQNTALTNNEALNVIRLEYLPQKFQARLNEDQTVLYTYLQLRNEVKQLALSYQEIGNIDINKISQQLKFSPETIKREIEYLILEGMINPRLVGRTV